MLLLVLQDFFKEADFDGLLTAETFQLSDFNFLSINMSLTLKRIPGILFGPILSLGNQVWAQIFFICGLGRRFACLKFAQDFVVELFGKDASFEAHGRWFPSQSIPP